MEQGMGGMGQAQGMGMDQGMQGLQGMQGMQGMQGYGQQGFGQGQQGFGLGAYGTPPTYGQGAGAAYYRKRVQ
jgi:hypothetical protein